MSDSYDHEQMDKEVARNMKGQTFIVTIRDWPDRITPDDLKTEITYNENDIEAADVDVEAISVQSRREALKTVWDMRYHVEDVA